ncbi:hypothetical protein D3C81_1519150 [compost metagenome]
MVLISTSAWVLKSMATGAGGTTDCVKLPGSEAPATRPFLPWVSSTQSPDPSALNLATYSVPLSSRLALFRRLVASKAALGMNL